MPQVEHESLNKSIPYEYHITNQTSSQPS